MNFISSEFVILLPLIVWMYRLCRRGYKWIFLLVVSYGFYFYFNRETTALLLAVSLFTYFMGLYIEKNRSRRKPAVFMTAIVLLGILIWYKYTGFSAVLPVGISFYTFQTLSYVIDVYRGDTKAERSPGHYLLFVSFFPQLVAGPIERSGALLPQLWQEKEADRTQIRSGIARIIQGFMKKLVIADYFSMFVDRIYDQPDQAVGFTAVLGTVLFAFQIYCDFSGYSDIAIGCGKLLGIDLRENFNRPYLAQSFRDFWHRWHMSLTGWFTDYVYKPLGGSRKGTLITCRNILLVFALSGLWHGSGFTFLLWGVAHGVFLVLERLLGKTSRAVTLAGVMWAWIFFRANSVHDAFVMMTSIPKGWTISAIADQLHRIGYDGYAFVYTIVAMVLLYKMPVFVDMLQDSATKGLVGSDTKKERNWLVFISVLLIISAWMMLMTNHTVGHFIYFQF